MRVRDGIGVILVVAVMIGFSVGIGAVGAGAGDSTGVMTSAPSASAIETASLTSPTQTHTETGRELETDDRGPQEGTQWNVTVTRVIDGDTIEAEFPNGDTETLRLLGVDTPETTLNSVSPSEFEEIPDTTDGRDHLFEWGQNATQFATQTLANTEIAVETDEQADRRGFFGRLLVFAYTDTDTDSPSFNRQLLTQGYARFYESEFSTQDEFESAETQAQQNNTGVWNYRSNNTTEDPDPDPATETDDDSIEIVTIHEDAMGPGDESDNLNDEYVILENPTNTTVELTGWTVEDEAGATYEFPSGFTLESAETVTLRTGEGTDTDTELYWGFERPIWNNNGDTVTVTAADDTIIAERSYPTEDDPDPDQPDSPGEVTNATTDNPSPSENRGVAAGVTPYTTADDVLGGVGNGAVIFQGEEDIVFERTDRTDINPSELERTAGDNEGVTLSFPIPDDQAEGGYSNEAGFSVTVQEPRVTTLEVQNNTERDVSGGILEPDQNDASVFVEYNYEEAENIELTVEDKDGIDVTGEALDAVELENKNADRATPRGTAPDGSVRFELNPSNLDEGEYTFSVAGVEDLDSGVATQSVTTTITADQTASLSLSEDEAVQGSDTTFSVENSLEGEFHPVVIDESEFRDGVSLFQAADVFRNVGDTVETGVADTTGPGASDIDDVEYAYAIIEIDGGNGVGSVETQFLDDSSATVELYPSDGVTPIESHPADVVLTTDDGFETDDEEDLVLVGDTDTEPTSVVDEYDADNDGDISIIELGQAGQAFASGELTITELGEVGAAFAS